MEQSHTSDKPRLPPHREWHGEHMRWEYRPHAYRWDGDELVGINFIPLARDMRAWMRQRGQLPLVSMADYQKKGRYTNPYTYSGGALALLLSRVVNAYHDYSTLASPEEDPVDAEIERLRLYNEVVLYSARMCEVLIKQLLYCTQIPPSRYETKGLGALLESPCPSCKKANGKQPHLVSLLTSLAHPFHLCLEFEHCAMDHMALVNKLRNSQAAHSGIQSLNLRTAQDSKTELESDCGEVLSGFRHMLSHLEKLEENMLDDLAEKGASIERLRRRGLPAELTNFRLVPGEIFKYEPEAPDPAA